MLLSIIIPHYNLPRPLLQRCIDSILATELPTEEYEIIIIDDGSATPPRWVETAYTSNNITLIENEHNCQGAARNTGIEAAQGEYIQFVDADDTLQRNNALQQCTEWLKHEKPDILRFKYKVRTKLQTSNKKQKTTVHFGNTISGAAYMADNNLHASVWSFFVKKELLIKKEIRFTSGIYHEDEEFSTILHYHAKTLTESDAQIYNYCVRENSTITTGTAQITEKRLKDRMTVLKNLATFKAATNSQSNSIQKKALQRKLSTLVADTIINHLRTGKTATEIYDLCTHHIAPLALYPIANGNYGYKFKIFRKLANSRLGLHILRMMIPTTQKPTKE